MPRPRSLTTQQIAAAALAVIDRDGLPALSMRTAAEELGRRPMALYRYVEDREELECLVVDLTLGAALREPAQGPPRARLLALLAAMREAVAAHPGVLPLAVRHHGGCLAVMRWREWLLEALADAGVAGPARAGALHVLVSYVIGALEVEQQGVGEGVGGEAFPLLAEALAQRSAAEPGEAFAGGARAVLDGLGVG
ncbi:TetR/AcrR family transcriptional regulator [Kitasatospora sp. NPDC006697]|uniref:TetR/AcrR family transcriptional regulator n=1 Tax=Kitasatospora sp. NPDC006697 TaxID=3364020 RepID=UPI0036B474BB